MLGQIIGDVSGSKLEVLELMELKKRKIRNYQDRIKIMDRNIPLFNIESTTTDDSCLTVAVADAILNNKSYDKVLREYGKLEISFGLDKYGRNRFGKGFINWLNSDEIGNSYGNGCAMRVGPVGYLFENIDQVKYNAYKATIPSHNHPDSIKCAEAVAISVYLLRKGYTKEQLKKYINDNYFNIDFNLEQLRYNYKFTSKAIDSVPQAIYCFIISETFEDAIRKALSIGGDSDTIACITGSLAECYYGIEEQLINDIRPYIKNYMKPIINQFYKKKVFK